MIAHYQLHGLLHACQTFAVNTDDGECSLLEVIQNEAKILQQLRMSPVELSVLLPLLVAYPYHCSYEIIYTTFRKKELTEKNIEQSRIYLEAARLSDIWDIEIRPSRAAVSRARLKLRSFHIEVISVMSKGYLLIPSENSLKPVSY